MMRSVLQILTLMLAVCTVDAFIGQRGSSSIGGNRSVASNQLFYFVASQDFGTGAWEDTLVEGVIHTNPNGDSFVSWMWIIDQGEITLIPVFQDSALDPYYQCQVFSLGDERKIIDLNAMNYPKRSALSNRNESAAPLPSGVVLLDRAPFSTTNEGWVWAGSLIQFDQIGSSGDSQCKPPPTGEGGDRYVIPISPTEILIIIINQDGTVTVLVYKLGEDGCWRFSVTPDTYEPPPLPGFTGQQTLPLVLMEYLFQFLNGYFQNTPPFPII